MEFAYISADHKRFLSRPLGSGDEVHIQCDLHRGLGGEGASRGAKSGAPQVNTGVSPSDFSFSE
jgi:hypothetical protein